MIAPNYPDTMKIPFEYKKEDKKFRKMIVIGEKRWNYQLLSDKDLVFWQTNMHDGNFSNVHCNKLNKQLDKTKPIKVIN